MSSFSHPIRTIVIAGALVLAACGGAAAPSPTGVPSTPTSTVMGGTTSSNAPGTATISTRLVASATATVVTIGAAGTSPTPSPPLAALSASPTPLPSPTPTATSPPSPTATPTMALVSTPTATATVTPTPGNDTPPTTTTGCDLAVSIGLLETIPGTYQVTTGLSEVGGTGCAPPVTVNFSVTPSSALTLGSLSVAYEYNGAASWTCSGTSCQSSGAIPGNPPGTMYQVGFQTMATLSGTAQLCATVTSSADTNTANDTWCEVLP